MLGRKKYFCKRGGTYLDSSHCVCNLAWYLEITSPTDPKTEFVNLKKNIMARESPHSK